MREWRLIIAVGRRVKEAVRARFVGVVMRVGQPLMPVGVVMVLAFEVRQIVLRFFCYGSNSAD
jgi:hypothetical protein